jgi:hypothetical protein
MCYVNILSLYASVHLLTSFYCRGPGKSSNQTSFSPGIDISAVIVLHLFAANKFSQMCLHLCLLTAPLAESPHSEHTFQLKISNYPCHDEMKAQRLVTD